MNIRLVHPMPIEIEPRPCGRCGLTVDRHEMDDDGDGPLFFCAEIDSENLTLPELERREIRRALQATNGSVGKAAKLLGLSRATLYRRLSEVQG